MIKKNILKYKIIAKHIEFTQVGKYKEAKNLLFLLRNGRVNLGLSDADFETECFLESIGCPVHYDRNGNIATFKI